MNEDSASKSFLKQKRIKNIHLLIIISSIPLILLGFLFFKIYLYNNYLYYFLVESALFLLFGTFIFLFSSRLERNQYLIGLFLTHIFSFSFSMTFFTSSQYYPLYIYFITLCIYHYSEYFSVLIYHFEKINYEYFLIDQSKGWILATIISFLETFLGIYFFNKYKKIQFFFIIGLFMTIIGQIFRIGGLYTGKKNFTHKIRFEKVKGHRLVTNGVFAITRHPSYFGFYLWSVGIEIMCCNPICTSAFIIILFNFFRK